MELGTVRESSGEPGFFAAARRRRSRFSTRSSTGSPLGEGGNVVRTWRVAYGGGAPNRLQCAPGGGVVFTGWGETRGMSPSTDITGGPWRCSRPVPNLVPTSSGRVGPDRTVRATRGRMVRALGGGPRVFGAVWEGVWFGAGDDYETGVHELERDVPRRTRWSGPDPGSYGGPHRRELRSVRLVAEGERGRFRCASRFRSPVAPHPCGPAFAVSGVFSPVDG